MVKPRFGINIVDDSDYSGNEGLEGRLALLEAFTSSLCIIFRGRNLRSLFAGRRSVFRQPASLYRHIRRPLFASDRRILARPLSQQPIRRTLGTSWVDIVEHISVGVHPNWVVPLSFFLGLVGFVMFTRQMLQQLINGLWGSVHRNLALLRNTLAFPWNNWRLILSALQYYRDNSEFVDTVCTFLSDNWEIVSDCLSHISTHWQVIQGCLDSLSRSWVLVRQTREYFSVSANEETSAGRAFLIGLWRIIAGTQIVLRVQFPGRRRRIPTMIHPRSVGLLVSFYPRYVGVRTVYGIRVLHRAGRTCSYENANGLAGILATVPAIHHFPHVALAIAMQLQLLLANGQLRLLLANGHMV